MTRSYISFLLISLCFSFGGKAQVIKGAAIAGLNLSQVDGDEVYGFNKAGLNIGASAIVPFSDHWEVSIETIFIQKGSYQKPGYDDSLTGEYKLKLNYLEVPVLIHYNDRGRMALGAGLSWGRLASVEEYEHGKKVESTTINGPYDKSDFNVLFDFRFRIYKRLKANIRYAYSIDKIRTRVFQPPYSTDSWSRKQYNNLWSLRLIYVFNENVSERIRKENKLER